jgi:hypothetical protein
MVMICSLVDVNTEKLETLLIRDDTRRTLCVQSKLLNRDPMGKIAQNTNWIRAKPVSNWSKIHDPSAALPKSS